MPHPPPSSAEGVAYATVTPPLQRCSPHRVLSRRRSGSERQGRGIALVTTNVALTQPRSGGAWLPPRHPPPRGTAEPLLGSLAPARGNTGPLNADPTLSARWTRAQVAGGLDALRNPGPLDAARTERSRAETAAVAIAHAEIHTHSRSEGQTAAEGIGYRCGEKVYCPRSRRSIAPRRRRHWTSP